MGVARAASDSPVAANHSARLAPTARRNTSGTRLRFRILASGREARVASETASQRRDERSSLAAVVSTRLQRNGALAPQSFRSRVKSKARSCRQACTRRVSQPPPLGQAGNANVIEGSARAQGVRCPGSVETEVTPLRIPASPVRWPQVPAMPAADTRVPIVPAADTAEFIVSALRVAVIRSARDIADATLRLNAQEGR